MIYVAELNKLTLFISAFMVLILGMILLGVLADNIWANTNTDSRGNETVTITSRTGQVEQTDIISLTSIYNYTLSFTPLIGTQFNISSTGVITTNSTTPNGTYFVAYTFYPELYVANGTSRTLLSLIVLFFALAVVAVTLGMLINIGKGTIF